MSAGEVPFRLTASSEGAAGGERRWWVEIPAASPLFVGHFPGQPILPGIAHLAIVERAFGRALTGVRSLKLRRPVGPGDVLDLWIFPTDAEGWTRFELRRDGAAVSSGSVATASLPGGEGDGVVHALPPSHSPSLPAIGALLPHGPPARLVQEVTAAANEELFCTVTIPPGHPFAGGGRAPAFLGIEAAAQAAAALEALNRSGIDAGPRIGYLVGVRSARFAVPCLPAGRSLRATVRRQGSAPPLAIYAIAVQEGDHAAVTGTISTYLADPTRGE